MKYKDKERIVSQSWFAIMANKSWSEVQKFGDLGFPLAYGGQNDLCLVGSQGQEYVEEVYDVLLTSLGIPDGEYESWSEMCTVSYEVQGLEIPSKG